MELSKNTIIFNETEIALGLPESVPVVYADLVLERVEKLQENAKDRLRLKKQLLLDMGQNALWVEHNVTDRENVLLYGVEVDLRRIIDETV